MRENLAREEKESPKGVGDEQKKVPYTPNRIEFSRLFKIMGEFMRGFNILKKYCLAVTFFGTSRCKFDDDVYQNARELASRLSKDGFTVITGGGEGIMSAANQGAKEAGGDSVGLNIDLPKGEGGEPNPYLTDSEDFHYFFIRKMMLSFSSEVYVFMPGGFGTMDEFFEIITLIQTKKIQKIPVVLIDSEYWTPLLSWIEETLYKKNGAIDEEDMDIYHVVDSVDEAHEYIKKLVPIEQLRAC